MEPEANPVTGTIAKMLIYAKGKWKQKSINKDYAPERRMRRIVCNRAVQVSAGVTLKN